MNSSYLSVGAAYFDPCQRDDEKNGLGSSAALRTNKIQTSVKKSYEILCCHSVENVNVIFQNMTQCSVVCSPEHHRHLRRCEDLVCHS
jgi:hypothetical protein